MFRLSFVVAALISSTQATTDYTFSESDSTTATVKLRALSAAVFKHHQGGTSNDGENTLNTTPTSGCAHDVYGAITDMQ